MGGDWELPNPKEVLEAQSHVWIHEAAFVKSMCLKCAVELDIPDAIHKHGGPMTLDELVAATKIQPSKAHCLRRIMRLLVHLGFFELHKESGRDDREGGGAYALNSASKLLIRDHPLCIRASVLLALSPTMLKPWSSVTAWLRSIDPTAQQTANGENLWGLMASSAELNDSFNEFAEGTSRIEALAVMGENRSVFEGLKSLVDIAGGTGTMAKAIASAFPSMECTVMDLPHVVAGLEGTNNLKFVAGDMFQKIPPANALMMKRILHDWDDEKSVKILKNCREALPPKEEGGKLIIIDMVLADTKQDYPSKEFGLIADLAMLISCNGTERNEKEWAKLLTDAGFSSYKIHYMHLTLSLIEAYP